MLSVKDKEHTLDEIKNNFKKAWLKMCDQQPPETIFYIYSTKSGQTPMHDRYIVTDEAGLLLGTSLNGFGKRQTTITYLDIDQKNTIEKEIINVLITTPPLTFNGEKLSLKTFAFDI